MVFPGPARRPCSQLRSVRAECDVWALDATQPMASRGEVMSTQIQAVPLHTRLSAVSGPARL